MASRKIEKIEIPMSLARLLAAAPEDFKRPEEYADIKEVARTQLVLLIEANK